MVYLAAVAMLIYGVAFLFTIGLCVAAGRADDHIEAAMARIEEGGER